MRDPDPQGSSSRLHDDPQPRTSGDVAQQPPVQLAIVLLMMLLGLLALWVVWSLIYAA
jgi:hypothetical protein